MKKALTANNQGLLDFEDTETFDSSRALRPAPALCPRQARALDALLCGGWVGREELDMAAAASNGPDVIFRLRDKLGDHNKEIILTKRERIVDLDGRIIFPGRYAISSEGRKALLKSGLAVYA